MQWDKYMHHFSFMACNTSISTLSGVLPYTTGATFYSVSCFPRSWHRWRGHAQGNMNRGEWVRGEKKIVARTEASAMWIGTSMQAVAMWCASHHVHWSKPVCLSGAMFDVMTSWCAVNERNHLSDKTVWWLCCMHHWEIRPSRCTSFAACMRSQTETPSLLRSSSMCHIKKKNAKT